MKWSFQECEIYWSVWSFGVRTYNHRGWSMDERHIFFGPWVFVFVSSTQMEKA